MRSLLRVPSLRATFEALNRSQAIIEFETDGTIITANENFLAAMGYKLDDVRGKHHRMFVDPAYAASSAYHDFWAKLNQGEFMQAQFKRMGSGGREVWIEASYNPLLNVRGRVFRVVKFATDITAQKISVMGRTEGILDAGQGEVALHDTASVHGRVRYGRIQVNGADLNATLERVAIQKTAA